jgi:hypothetical protein
MGRIKPTTLEEYEKEDAEWWCFRHKDNCASLVINIYRILNEDGKTKKMMQAQLKSYAEACGVDLDEID